MPPARPGENPRVVPRHLLPVAPVAPVATPAPQDTVAGSEWGPSTLTGSRVLNVGGFRFRVPRDARVKSSRRSGVVWVNVAGETYIFSELGQLAQTAAERRATKFELL